MKKIIYMLGIVLLLSGCNFAKQMSNTPTKKVEAFLNKYQTLDAGVLSSLDSVLLENTSFTTAQRDKYRDIIKNNYQKMTYKIKDETVDGDDAVVEVEIEVVDYSKTMADSEIYKVDNPDEFLTDDVYDESKFIDYRLDLLKDVKEKVKYTMNLTLTKVNNEWVLDDLSRENEDKLNGIYNY